jgi:thymidylate kinase
MLHKTSSQTPTDLKPLHVSQQLLDSLCQAGVGFVLWKSNSHVAQALAGRTDLDLFVRRQDEERFVHAVEALGAIKISSQSWASYPDVEDWLVFDYGTGNFLHMHVHYRLLTGLKRVKHLRLPWEDLLMSNLRRHPSNKWPIPTAEMELITLLVRAWAKMPPWRRLFRPKVPNHIREEFRWLLVEAAPAAVMNLVSKLGLRFEPKSLELLSETDSDRAIVAAARQLYAQMLPNYRMSWGQALLMTGSRNGTVLLSRLRQRLHGFAPLGKRLPRGGIMIAVIGTDGSGKSTLCSDLTDWLAFKLDTHRLYLGSGDGAGGLVHSLRRRAKTILSRRSKNKRVVQVSEVEPQMASFWGRLYRLLDLNLMRRKVSMLHRARKLVCNGSIVICDRYPQAQVNGLSDGPRLQGGRGFAWAAAAERELYKKAADLGPDLLIRLRVDPKTAQSRKPDHALEAIVQKCRIVDELQFPRSIDHGIDANRGYSDVLLEAKRTIWTHLNKQRR